MPTLTISIIGHNNGHQLARCLESVQWADEIIYVDCESSDDSLTIVGHYTEHIFQRPNNTNLNVNKSFGIAQATSDWILYLDPDEIVPPALAEEIRQLLLTEPKVNAFKLPRRNYFFGRWLRYGGQYPDMQLRLFRRGKASFPCLHVHERLRVEGATGRLKNAMDHYTADTPADVIRKIDLNSNFNAELMARSGMRLRLRTTLKMLFLKPVTRFGKRYFLKRGFQDGWPGLFVVAISSLEFWFRYFKFWYLVEQASSGANPGSSPANAVLEHGGGAGSNPGTPPPATPSPPIGKPGAST